MRVCILGSSGNMGRRYAAICDYMDIEWHPCDPASHTKDAWAGDFSHYIIASPTDSHLGDILKIRSYKKTKTKPILCEKPVLMCESKGALASLQAVVEMHEETYMVNNYCFVDFADVDPGNEHTIYAYYNSGPHGIVWDCIQLIAMAKNGFSATIESPRWFAQINGRVVYRDSIDVSYISMVEAFLADHQELLWGPRRIVEAHRKALDWVEWLKTEEGAA